MNKKTGSLVFGCQRQWLYPSLSVAECAQLRRGASTREERDALNRIRLKLMGIDCWTLRAPPTVDVVESISDSAPPSTSQEQSAVSPAEVAADPVAPVATADRVSGRRVESEFPSCYVYGLWRQGQRLGLLLAAAEEETTAVAELLAKISVALHCELRGRWYQQQPLVFNDTGIVLRKANASGVRQQLDVSGLRFVVTLGAAIVVGDDYKQAIPLIQSYAPQQLLAEPAFKRETWHSLQAVFPLLT